MPAPSRPTSTSSSLGKELAETLSGAQSTTIYVDAEINDQDVHNLLLGEAHLHAEFDLVRQLWAIRAATEQEVAEAEAAAAPSPSPASSSTATSSST